MNPRDSKKCWKSVKKLKHLPISHGSYSVLYADDLLLFHAIESQEDFHLLQSDVSIIDDWVQKNYLTLNSGKCICTVISRKRRLTNPGTLYLGDVPLEQVQCFKYLYLGVILSSDLSFSQHIRVYTCSKARKILGLYIVLKILQQC